MRSFQLTGVENSVTQPTDIPPRKGGGMNILVQHNSSALLRLCKQAYFL